MANLTQLKWVRELVPRVGRRVPSLWFLGMAKVTATPPLVYPSFVIAYFFLAVANSVALSDIVLNSLNVDSSQSVLVCGYFAPIFNLSIM